MTEHVVSTLITVAPDVPVTRRPALTRRASLNAAAALVDYTARLVTGLVVTPILVRGLGSALFGSWEMLARLGGYVSASDGRPTEALRLVVAHTQDRPDAAKRRLVGAALVVWLLLLPVVISLGGALIYWSPQLVGVAGEQASAMRLAATCLVGSMLLGSLASVPESVLRGLNLGHTRIGMQSALHFFGGALSAAAVWVGFGVVGLGAATLLRAIATGGCFWLLVRRRVEWFGAARPERSEVRSLLSMSLWLTAGELLARLVLASDVVILGTVLSTTAVTTYVLTGYAAKVAVGVHVFTAGEAMPGFGALLGRDELLRARKARGELLTLTWLYATIAGAVVLLWNRSFISWWVGGEQYAGIAVDLLIVLTAMQTAFIRVDSGIIDAALRPRQRVVVAAAAAAVTLALAIALTHWWGMLGLCIGLLAGRSVQTVAYPLLVRQALGRAVPTAEGASGLRPAARAIIATSLLFPAALLAGRGIGPVTWPLLAGGIPLSIALVTVVTLAVGADPGTRIALRERASTLLRGRRPR